MAANTIALGTILIADVNQSAREVLEMMLRRHGYRVFAVSDGQQALQLLEQEAIDLALIDVVMPGQSGFAVCRAAKDRPETRLTPIVLITGLGGWRIVSRELRRARTISSTSQYGKKSCWRG